MPELFDHPDIAYWTPNVSPFDEVAARARLDQDRPLRTEGTAILLAITVDGGAPLREVMLRRAPEGTELGYAVGPARGALVSCCCDCPTSPCETCSPSSGCCR